ncbi:MAG: phenylacetate--CoA ligase [Bacillota bacterium]|nr:phenylacetate--CoA ligase [Bacillota bacterium]
MVRYWQEERECASREWMSEWQSQQLRETVQRVYENVAPYRKRMEEAGIRPEDIRGIEDLHRLPFTCKQDLRDYYPYEMFAVPMEEVVRIHASSGTTGKQIVVGYTRNDLNIWADTCARALVSAGADNKDFMHVSYGYGLFTGGLGLHGGAEKLGMTTIPVSTGNSKRQLTIMKDFGSTVICCTPSYALHLGETLKDMGIPKEELRVKAGLFGAEPWTEEMRREIEAELGLKAYDIYGLTEIIGPGVAFECECQSGMHINEDHFIPEIIDPESGEVLPLGSSGELVFTCITKEAFPLIRYRTRDIATLDASPCACGRKLIKMKKPQGRSDDMLIIRGVNVFPSQIESVLLSLGYTAPYYQLVVERINNTDQLEIQVELNEEHYSDTIKSLQKITRTIAEAVQSTLGISAKIRVMEARSLPRAEGKAVHVIDKRKLV